MRASLRRTLHGGLLAAMALVPLAACASRTRAGGGPRPANAPAGRRATMGALDPVAAYASAGFIAEAQPVQFIGNVLYLAGTAPDSTLMLLTLSLANRALTFAPGPDGQLAHYQVQIDLKQGDAVARHIDARETVRIGSFRETSRSDESIIFQQFLPAAPGQYVLAVSVRDEGSARNGIHELLVSVPRIAPIALSSPIAVYDATPRASTDAPPDLIANPRSTSIFGRDSVVQVYLEGYGLPAETPVTLAALGDKQEVLWRDTVLLRERGDHVRAEVINIPVAQLGVGRITLTATPLHASDTVRAPIFVTFGDEWAITSYDEMVSFLRFFANDNRLAQLRAASGTERVARWAEFYAATDPDPRTPEHEGLIAYFNRIRTANDRFNDEGNAGWMSDRGEVFVTLGEPDQVLEQGDNTFSQRGRAQVWQYNQQRLQLVFIDQTGFGRWRLTSSSEADFQAAAGRVRR